MLGIVKEMKMRLVTEDKHQFTFTVKNGRCEINKTMNPGEILCLFGQAEIIIQFLQEELKKYCETNGKLKKEAKAIQ